MEVAGYIDHTLLKPNATAADIEKLCREALEYRFATVCVNPWHVQLCAGLLQEAKTGVCAVIGFPLGANKSETKTYEAQLAVEDGASEVDMVMNIGELLSGNNSVVEADIAAVVQAVAGRALVKVILETDLLQAHQIQEACLIAKTAGADFVKTSTGFSGGGATVGNIRLMRETVGPDFGVKASGGIRDFPAAKAMIDAGATRLGASSGVAIVKGQQGIADY